MKNFILSILLLILILNLSSCLYYKGMPEEWNNQLSVIENCETFNGKYTLAHDDKRHIQEYYNDLLRFNKYPIVRSKREQLGWITSINIEVSSDEVIINSFSYGEPVHESRFKKDSFECKNNTLILNIENHFAAEDVVAAYIFSILTLYKGVSDEVFVKQTDTTVGTILFVPVIGGSNQWFKLKKSKHNQANSADAENSAAD